MTAQCLPPADGPTHLVGLAKGLGLQTVAEMTETSGEAAMLRGEGVGFLQGYYFGRPSLEKPWLDKPVIALRRRSKAAG